VEFPKSEDEISEALTAGAPKGDSAADALMTKLLVGVPVVKGKFVSEIEITEDPSKGMLVEDTEATWTFPLIGGTEVNVNDAFLSLPTRTEYTTIGYVANSVISGDLTVT
jgi:hypothetical protein